jgi:hypothetical protein
MPEVVTPRLYFTDLTDRSKALYQLSQGFIAGPDMPTFIPSEAGTDLFVAADPNVRRVVERGFDMTFGRMFRPLIDSFARTFNGLRR